MSKDDRELIELTKPQEAADTKLADLFPEWELDQRQCIAAIVADAVLAAARLEAPQAQPVGEASRLREAVENAIAGIEAGNLYEPICCSGGGQNPENYCGCRGSSNADLLIYHLREALTASPPVVEREDAMESILERLRCVHRRNPSEYEEVCSIIDAVRALSTPVAQGDEDTKLLDALRDESWDLRCFDIQTGGGDADVGWMVVGHYQGEPAERTIAEEYRDDPRAAIRSALATLTKGARDE